MICRRHSYSLAEVGVIPYINRLDMLQLSGMWTERRPHLTRWFERLKARPSFEPAMFKYVPPALRKLMQENRVPKHGPRCGPS